MSAIIKTRDRAYDDCDSILNHWLTMLPILRYNYFMDATRFGLQNCIQWMSTVWPRHPDAIRASCVCWFLVPIWDECILHTCLAIINETQFSQIQIKLLNGKCVVISLLPSVLWCSRFVFVLPLATEVVRSTEHYNFFQSTNSLIYSWKCEWRVSHRIKLFKENELLSSKRVMEGNGTIQLVPITFIVCTFFFSK